MLGQQLQITAFLLDEGHRYGPPATISHLLNTLQSELFQNKPLLDRFFHGDDSLRLGRGCALQLSTMFCLTRLLSQTLQDKPICQSSQFRPCIGAMASSLIFLKRATAHKPEDKSLHLRALLRLRLKLTSLVPLTVLLHILCLKTECRVTGSSGPAVSALHGAPPVPPQAPSISLPSNQRPLKQYGQKHSAELSSSQRPFYVLLNNEAGEFQPSLLVDSFGRDSKEARETLQLEDQGIRVISFWQRSEKTKPSSPKGLHRPEDNVLVFLEATPPNPPLLLHIPAVRGGWAHQTDAAAAERAALAGAAAACSDLLLLSLPLDTLDAPTSLMPLQQPFPLLFAALELQLQLQSMLQKDRRSEESLSQAVASFASRTKPLVVLLRDPAALTVAAGGALTNGKANLAAQQEAQYLRHIAAHTVLRILEKHWLNMVKEMNVKTLGAQQNSQSQQQHQQGEQPDDQAQQDHGIQLPPGLLERFSLHVVFVQRLPQKPLSACAAALQQALSTLLREHRSREERDKLEDASVRHQRGQLPRSSDAAHRSRRSLFNAAVAACRVLVAAPETELAADSRETLPCKPGAELSTNDAAAFDVEMCRRKALTRCV